ncbi:hypothetical protein ASPWEDRAFT_113274 [Aspergillus wentii DTO 134E9]|uniref:Zn(2)-C6 fungal-type domain-containing protein n=1 Tax=Aspergillus wentii DTO 134E9 TaxID=1073089 RepID=A0A1L9RI41_ASPWE|nr:uncharacterized protein ASPWEDRAFT_113274 [Aspergillus wentii DTO 134E9]KAI9925916.1 hypothetical protein MW887_005722 [Aspergillus wentii]OJJ34600.1 hypothetical protein ASPWEDRAFT_113274 [Aspergillus wentii DTO 134E9]
MSDTPTQSMRKRARKACEPCRERKRKCNGRRPCSSCVRFEYECSFESRERRIHSPVNTPSHQSHQTATTPKLTPNDHSFVQSLEANSGPAFVRRLALSIDPANAPRPHVFAWNVGPRGPSSVEMSSASRIADLISESNLNLLASVYFEKIDPCYGFINRESFFRHVRTRWTSPDSTDGYDAVLCGVAALGSFFSRQSTPSVEGSLIKLSRSILDNHITSGVPSIDMITGWVCQVVYLRMTAAPLAAWMASCTTMHLIEAAGLHFESPTRSNTVLTPITADPNIRQRLVGVAQHLHTWISFDLGLARVSLQQQPQTTTLQSTTPGDYTEKLLSLLPVSASLDPSEPQDEDNLHSTLSQLVSSQDHQPPLVMAQCNLLLCILRRIHTQSSHLIGKINEDPGMDAVLAFMRKALWAARTLADSISPWHQVANIPFQIVCTLLVIDSRASLRLLREAMQTLRHVTFIFQTSNLKEACSNARLLLWLHQKRRTEDVNMVTDVLASDASADAAAESDGELGVSSEVELAWIDSLTAGMPSLQDIDADLILNGDYMI